MSKSQENKEKKLTRAESLAKVRLDEIEWEKNSLEVKIKQWILKRHDKLNFTVHFESKSKTGNLTKKYCKYYATLYYALRRFYSELTLVNRKDLNKDLFKEYKDIKPEQGTKDLSNEIKKLVNKMVKNNLR